MGHLPTSRRLFFIIGNIELSPVSVNDDDTGDKFALQADVNDKETLQNLRIHTWSMNIESAYLEVKLTIWT